MVSITNITLAGSLQSMPCPKQQDKSVDVVAKEAFPLLVAIALKLLEHAQVLARDRGRARQTSDTISTKIPRAVIGRAYDSRGWGRSRQQIIWQ